MQYPFPVFDRIRDKKWGLWLHMGVVGIALAMGIDWTVKAALDLVRYRGGKWRSIQVI